MKRSYWFLGPHLLAILGLLMIALPLLWALWEAFNGDASR